MKKDISNGVFLAELFHNIDSLVSFLETNKNEDLWPELEIAFRLINAEKRDKRFEKQLLHAIQRIEAKSRTVAEIIKKIEKSSQDHIEPINFNTLLQYALYLKSQHPSVHSLENGNKAYSKRVVEIIKRGNPINLNVD